MIRFLDPWMLLFAAAAMVPPLVAWTARHEPVVRGWGAMEILLRAAERTAFRRRLLDWLSIAARVAMLLLVAFASARPLFIPSHATEESRAAGDGDRERPVIVVGESCEPLIAAIEAVASSKVSVRSIAKEGLDAAPLETAAIVVLADGVAPSRAAAARLHRMVDRGGTVVVVVGPKSSEGPRAGTLAAFVESLAGIGIGEARDEPGGIGVWIDRSGEGEPPMALHGPTVWRRTALLAGRSPPGYGGGNGGAVEVLASTASGSPLAIRVSVGRGTAGVVAVPLGLTPTSTIGPRAWTDLPAWPAFVPFVERTILSEAGGPPHTDLAGPALAIALAVSLAEPVAALVAVLGSRLQ